MSIKMKHLPITERPYEKLEQNGEKTLTNAELLAIIIKSGTKEESSIQLAQRILTLSDKKDKNNLSFLREITIEELTKIKGIGKVKAIQIKAICELASRMNGTDKLIGTRILKTQDIGDLLFEEMRYETQEILKVAILDNKNKLLKIKDIAKGAKNVLKPLGKGLVAAGEQLAKLAKSAVETFKGTSLYTKMNENFTAIITKMDSNKYGKVVMDILRNVGHGIKVAAGYITKPLKEFAQKVKDTPFDTAYDKTAKAASTTLGVGAGLTSGYNEVMHPEDSVVEDDKIAENKDDISYSDIDEDDEVEEEK